MKKTLVLVSVTHTNEFKMDDIINLIGERLLNADWLPDGVTINPVNKSVNVGGGDA